MSLYHFTITINSQAFEWTRRHGCLGATQLAPRHSTTTSTAKTIDHCVPPGEGMVGSDGMPLR